MSKFLIWCSGADAELLERFRTDRAKYVGLGGAILMTTALAFFAFLFAATSVLDMSLPLALFGSSIWALGIFNLDRWLVSALRRRPTFWGNFLAFLPRLILALALGLVISEPIVLKVFEPEVEKEAQQIAFADAATVEKQLQQDPRYIRIPELEKEVVFLQSVVDGRADTAGVSQDPDVQALTKTLESKEQALSAAQAAVNCEVEGRTDCAGTSEAGSGKVGWGPAAGEKVRVRDEAIIARDEAKRALDAKEAEVKQRLASSAKATRESAAGDLKTKEADLAARKKALQADRDAYLGKNAESFGLLARMEALHHLGNRDATLLVAQWMLRFFIILIDVMPVLVKFLLSLFPPSAYERAVERLEADADQEHIDAISDNRERIRLAAEVDLHELQVKHEGQLNLADRVVAQMLAAEEDIASEQIAIWKQRTIDDIHANPDAYIVS